jgi:hypothetical protein
MDTQRCHNHAPVRVLVPLLEFNPFHKQNKIVEATNPAPGISQLIDGWYDPSAGQGDNENPTWAPPVSSDNAMTSPYGWISYPPGTPATLGSSPETLYHTVVKQSCRTCHVAFPNLDWTSFDQISQLLAPQSFARFRPTIEEYVCKQGEMPHSQITYLNFWLSNPSRPAILRQFEGPDWQPINNCPGAP